MVTEVQHGCKSSTNSETGRSKDVYDCAHTDLRDCNEARNGIITDEEALRNIPALGVHVRVALRG